MTELDKALQSAIIHSPTDLATAKRLLAEGANINAHDQYGDSIIDECLFSAMDLPPECDDCDENSCAACETRRTPDLLSIIDFFIDNGWDTARYGLRAVSTLVHTTHDRQMLDAAKRILEQPLSDDVKDYESALESIGTEESYQRCCEECHEQENLYFAMYEMVEARMKGKDFCGIHPYCDALGKRVDKIVCFADTIDFVQTPRGTEYASDLGFVCADGVIVVTANVNILLMNDRICEQPQIDVSDRLGDGIVGARIVDVSFEHKKVNGERIIYGQPTVIVKFDSGRAISFTHNFGELPDKRIQPRFLTSDDRERANNRTDTLYTLCDRVKIDLDKIEAYIINAGVTPEDITKTAIRLAKNYCYEVDTFQCENGRAPRQEELVTSNWLALYELLLRYGLDSASSYTGDGTNYDNVLQSLACLDNRSMVYKLFRLLLDHGASPNVVIKDESLFEEFDDRIVSFVTLLDIEGEDREAYEHDFRLWLLMIAYGAHLSNHGRILDMNDEYDIDVLANCEAFSYRREKTEDGWRLHIYMTKTGETVAILSSGA